jgi:hypothetical protein
MDSIRFKKDIVNSYEAFKELEKVRLNAVPKKKEWILNQSNLLPDMQNTLRYNNNAFEDDFWKNHNQYKLTPHIDYLPKYTPPYYSPKETGYGSFNSETFLKNLKRF